MNLLSIWSGCLELRTFNLCSFYIDLVIVLDRKAQAFFFCYSFFLDLDLVYNLDKSLDLHTIQIVKVGFKVKSV